MELNPANGRRLSSTEALPEGGVRLGLLGPLLVADDGNDEVDVGADRLRILLAALLVRANRTVVSASDAERLKAPLDANTNKIKQGKSNGWSLMYCKGPEGEQLEFVQVLGPVKQTFDGSLEKRRQMLGRQA